VGDANREQASGYQATMSNLPPSDEAYPPIDDAIIQWIWLINWLASRGPNWTALWELVTAERSPSPAGDLHYSSAYLNEAARNAMRSLGMVGLHRSEPLEDDGAYAAEGPES
jgi:hypothetical protein